MVHLLAPLLPHTTPSSDRSVRSRHADTLRTYFEQFGKVTHSNIMRDLDSQRSRGFAFLTFEDPASVTTVLSKDHYLDGKTVRLSPLALLTT